MSDTHLGPTLQYLRHLVDRSAPGSPSDREFLERFIANRDEESFTALLKRHGPMVLQVCRRVQCDSQNAEDIFQATFLLLARMARSIRNRDSVGSWLHGVACRLALKAREGAMRRQSREREAARVRKEREPPKQALQELQAALHEALERVPEKYRAPLILCYLEGRTQEEAAQQLGCPLGTVRSRLARGRDRLRDVLRRQGFELSATTLVVALAANTASASVPLSLLRTTGKAALAYAAGAKPAALVSASTVALLERALRPMLTAKAKLAIGGFVLLGALGLGTEAIVVRGPAAPEAPARPASPATEQLPEKRNDRSTVAAPQDDMKNVHDLLAVKGRVLDRQGKPLGGAELIFLQRDAVPTQLGSSDADGRFELQVPKEGKDRSLVARGNSAGIAFVNIESLKAAQQPVELRMVPDQVIRGRIVNTEGKPVSGAHVGVTIVRAFSGDRIDSFLIEWKQADFQSGLGLPPGAKALYPAGQSFFGVTTDADGRFTIAGMGAERFVKLHIHGPGIVGAELLVVNRDGFDPKPYNEAKMNSIPRSIRHRTWWYTPLYGPDISVVAELEKLIRGTVTDKTTGKPRPNALVRLTRRDDMPTHIELSAKTDQHGYYAIHSARKDKSYTLEVSEDAADGFLPGLVVATDTPENTPVIADIRVSKGVRVTGKVIDKATGKPVPGLVSIGVLFDNSFAKEFPDFESRHAGFRREKTATDGTFRIVTIPGRVLLMGGPDDRKLPGGFLEMLSFRWPVADPSYPQYFAYFTHDPAFLTYRDRGGGTSEPVQGNYCQVLDIKPDTTMVHQDIVLERCQALPVKIRDGENHPLSGAWATGISSRDGWTVRIDGDSCSAYDVSKSKPRIMVFHEPTRKLFGKLTLKGTEKGPVVAKLEPGGRATGRLLGANGEPLTGVLIDVGYSARAADEMHQRIHRAIQVVTGARGDFRVDELIPGLDFKLYYRRPGENISLQGKIDQLFRVEPGQVTELGDIRVNPVSGRKVDGALHFRPTRETPQASHLRDHALEGGNIPVDVVNGGDAHDLTEACPSKFAPNDSAVTSSGTRSGPRPPD